ncbi:MAG: hypothetical protein JWM93_1849 [Frankiales bacterium]|nr:hypothetical protein [Frankiales bacterium]
MTRVSGRVSAELSAPHTVAAAGHRRSAERLTGLDRPWLGVRAITSVGPIDVPSRDALVGALRMIAGVGPQSRVGLTLDARRRWWLYDPAELDSFCEAAVREMPPPNPRDVGAHLVDVSAAVPVDDLPIVLIIAGDYLTLSVLHALGDARIMMRLLTGVVQVARTGTLPSWVDSEREPHPLRVAIRHHFAGRHDRILALTRAMRPSLGSPPLQSRTPFTPSVSAVYARSSSDTVSDLRDWRKAHTAGASAIPVVFSAARAAFSAVGLTPARKSLVLFDGRRYLPHRGDVRGNFAVGLDLEVAEPHRPQDFASAIDAAAAVGRPLSALVAGMALAPVVRHKSARNPTVPTEPSPYLAFTHVGRPLDIARLPWKGDVDSRAYTGLLHPASPEGITLAFAETQGGIQVTASFHDSVFDRDRVRQAVQLACDDPIGCLDGLGAGIIATT